MGRSGTDDRTLWHLIEAFRTLYDEEASPEVRDFAEQLVKEVGQSVLKKRDMGDYF